MVAQSKTPEKDRQFVTSLSRGLTVLTCFGRERRDLSAMDVSRITGLPQPTVWRMCHTLLELGYLVHVPSSERMRLGVPVLGLGFAALAAQPISQLATPHMQKLAEQCKGAVALGTRDGLDIVYLQRCQGPSVLLTDLQVGARVPIARSATGWGYLAGLSPDALDELMRACKKQMGPQWSSWEKRIQAALADYRKVGYVLGIGVLHQEINSLALPIVSPDGETVMPISCGGQASVFTKEALVKLAPAVKRLADIISLGLSKQSKPL
jgi:DNA-binding IclR family transcriptional regulator